jgi:hypothetical protein
MSNELLLSNLDKILSNSEYGGKLLSFCCGLNRDNNYFKSTNKYYIIGKLCESMKPEIENYLNYLLMVVNNQISAKFHHEILNIHNINVILNSEHKESFISFLCGSFENRDDWIESEQFGNEYIMGLVIGLNSAIVFTFCRHLLKNTPEDNGDNGNNELHINGIGLKMNGYGSTELNTEFMEN